MNRRSFFKRMFCGVAASMGLPFVLKAEDDPVLRWQHKTPVAVLDLFKDPDESSEFRYHNDRVYLEGLIRKFFDLYSDEYYPIVTAIDLGKVGSVYISEFEIRKKRINIDFDVYHRQQRRLAEYNVFTQMAIEAIYDARKTVLYNRKFDSFKKQFITK